MTKKSRNFTMAFCAVVVVLAMAPPSYFAIINNLGPSTEYYEPEIEGAVLGPDGKYEAFIGDKVYVRYIVVRHQINGSCLLNVYRYGEEIGGPTPGNQHLLDYADLRFVGQNELRRPRWSVLALVSGYDVDEDGKPIPSKPLLAAGRESQEFALYVKARYFCNFMDYVFPRYLQGGERANETERVNIIIRRRKSD